MSAPRLALYAALTGATTYVLARYGWRAYVRAHSHLQAYLDTNGG